MNEESVVSQATLCNDFLDTWEPVYTERQRQFGANGVMSLVILVLLQTMESLQNGLPPLFNETNITSDIAVMTLTLSVNGPLHAHFR